MRPLPRAALPSALILSALGVACGGGDDDGGASGPSSSAVAVHFSDAPVDTASAVVVTVDSMTFRRESGEEIVVESFSSDELGTTDADTFTIDLLSVQGEDDRLVLESVMLPVGRYSELRLGVIDDDVAASYVVETDSGVAKPIKVPSDELKLGGFEVSPLSTQAFVVEFGLRQSMTYNPGPDRYILKPRGVRIVALEEAAAIVGEVDLASLNGVEPCLTKPEPGVGNAVYLYPGHGLDAAALADDFDATMAGDAADGRIAPLASTLLGDDGRYAFGFLEPGDYTVAASCMAAGDDPDMLDGLLVPAPDGQRIETSVARGQRVGCTFGAEAPSCATLVTEPAQTDPDGDEPEETTSDE